MCAKHVKYSDEELYEIVMNSDEENEDFDSEIRLEHSGDSSSSSNGSDIPEIHLFDDTNCGFDKNIPNFESITIFEHFMSNEIIDKIIAEIRNYKIYAIETKVVKEAEKFNVPDKIIAEIRNYKIYAIETKVVKEAEKFNVPSREEMYLFIAISLSMPQIKKQRVKDYWSKDFIIETPVFSQTMPQRLLVKRLYNRNTCIFSNYASKSIFRHLKILTFCK
ncbi:Transposase IS4 [Popillia japonica]|uniref:Transposase IS4 n=1 Tax=Popillia japonica TaxID=7064 RepID=A0AAW1LK40_POPJA